MYYCSNTIILSTPTIIRGGGVGSQNLITCKVLNPAGSGGLIILYSASGSMVSNIDFFGAQTGAVVNGVEVNGISILEGVSAYAYTGLGIELNGVGLPTALVDLSQVKGGCAEGNLLGGIRVLGGDANVITVLGFTSINNGGYNYKDEFIPWMCLDWLPLPWRRLFEQFNSKIQWKFVFSHASSLSNSISLMFIYYARNKFSGFGLFIPQQIIHFIILGQVLEHTIKEDRFVFNLVKRWRSVLLDRYSESGQPPSWIEPPSIAIGGSIHGAGFFELTPDTWLRANGLGALSVDGGFVLAVAPAIGSTGQQTVYSRSWWSSIWTHK